MIKTYPAALIEAGCIVLILWQFDVGWYVSYILSVGLKLFTKRI